MEISSMTEGEGEGCVNSGPGGLESGGTELMLCVKFLFSEYQLCTFHGEEFCTTSFCNYNEAANLYFLHCWWLVYLASTYSQR